MLIKKRQHGFTLIELMVIAPIVIIAVIGTVALLINLIAENAITNAENSASAEVQSALNEIQNSLSNSKGLLASQNLPDTNSSNYPSGTPTSGSPFIGMRIIGETFDQTADGPAFQTISPDNCGSAARVNNPIRSTNTIYFAQNEDTATPSKAVLKRRVLTTTTPPICGTSIIIRSCEAGNTAPCNQDDILVRDVVKFSTTYYTAPTTTTTDPTTATSAKVDIVVKKTIGSKDITYSGSNRFDLLND